MFDASGSLIRRDRRGTTGQLGKSDSPDQLCPNSGRGRRCDTDDTLALRSFARATRVALGPLPEQRAWCTQELNCPWTLDIGNLCTAQDEIPSTYIERHLGPDKCDYRQYSVSPAIHGTMAYCQCAGPGPCRHSRLPDWHSEFSRGLETRCVLFVRTQLRRSGPLHRIERRGPGSETNGRHNKTVSVCRLRWLTLLDQRANLLTVVGGRRSLLGSQWDCGCLRSEGSVCDARSLRRALAKKNGEHGPDLCMLAIRLALKRIAVATTSARDVVPWCGRSVRPGRQGRPDWRESRLRRQAAQPVRDVVPAQLVLQRRDIRFPFPMRMNSMPDHRGEVLEVSAVSAWLKLVWWAPPARIHASARTLEIGSRDPDRARDRQLRHRLVGLTTSTSLRIMRMRRPCRPTWRRPPDRSRR